MILLDTNAILWVKTAHARAADLVRGRRAMYISPASLLELRFLIEAGRIRLKGAGTLAQIADDDRWTLDDPPAAAWFARAMDLGWTRDPFDRLLVAHALQRGWRLATGDDHLLKQLRGSERLEL
jgi:PIN domain nuclease of toxin-antitoxin system